MKTIEQYIQFAINNGYDSLIVEKESFGFFVEDKDYIIVENIIEWEFLFEIPILKIITSKPFIEAIARGIIKIECDNDWYDWTDILIDYGNWRKSLYNFNRDYEEISVLNDVTKYQSYAIRDNKLEEFITNLLPKN